MCRQPLQTDDTHSLIPKLSFGSTSTGVEIGGEIGGENDEKFEEESKFNQNKKTKPKPAGHKKNDKPKKEEAVPKKKEEHPVLDEHGTTYEDIVRRIEKMDVDEYEKNTDYEVVNLSSVEIPDEFISGGSAES